MRVSWIVAALAVATAGCGGNGAATKSGGGTVQFTASGEVLALGGYAFPPVNAGDADFVDGWEVHFTKFIAVFDKVTLSETPGLVGDRSVADGQEGGRDRRTVGDRPAQGGPLSGKGGSDEQAFPIEAIANQNLNGGAAFDSSVRYAFGFQSVPATASAKLLQIDAGDADYAEMVQNGWNVLYVGTATWKGDAAGVDLQVDRAGLLRLLGDSARRSTSASASPRRRPTRTARTPTTIRRWESAARITSAACRSKTTRRPSRRSPFTPTIRSGRASCTTRRRTSISWRRWPSCSRTAAIS